MEIITEVKASELLAVALFAQTQKQAEAENSSCAGVNVDVADCAIRLIATDRMNLALLKIDYDRDYKGINLNFTIPANLVKNIKRSTASFNNPVSIKFDTDTGLVSLEQTGNLFTAKVIGGNFPPWRQVIPEPFEPKFYMYPLTPLAVFDKASSLLKSKGVFYHNSGGGAGVVHIPLYNDRLFIGLVARSNKAHVGTITPMEDSYYD